MNPILILLARASVDAATEYAFEHGVPFTLLRRCAPAAKSVGVRRRI